MSLRLCKSINDNIILFISLKLHENELFTQFLVEKLELTIEENCVDSTFIFGIVLVAVDSEYFFLLHSEMNYFYERLPKLNRVIVRKSFTLDRL